jgi:hypothetical protein
VDRLSRKDKIKNKASKYIAKSTKFLLQRKKLIIQLNKIPKAEENINIFKEGLKNVTMGKIDQKKKLKTYIQ